MDRNILRQYLLGLAGANNRFFLENSRTLGNLPQNIVYNGLVYTLNLRENAFINQFGHRIDPSAAPAFITEARAFDQQNLAIMDISTVSSDNENSKGGQEIPLEGPSGLVLINNPGSSTTSIIVDWDAPVSYVPDSYKIYRSTSSVGPYFEAGTVGNPEITLFTNTGLSSGITYFYYVKAIKGGKESLSTETLNLATLSAEPPLVGITAPSGLTVSNISQTQLRLSWTDNSTNESGFFVYQSFDTLEYTPIFAVNTGITSANVKPLTPDTLYYYKVNAYATGSTSAFSNTISVRTLPNIPTAPSNLSLLVGGTSQIRISWSDNSTNEQFFNLYRSIDGISYPFGITLSAGSTTYLNTGLSAGQTYWYRVNAANTGGTSGFAGPSFASTLPLTPTTPSFTLISGTTNSITLNWTNVANETGYGLYRSATLAGTYTGITTLGANITSFTNTGLTSGTTFFYKIDAFNSGGTSALSGATSFTTLIAGTTPSAPTGFTAIAAGTNSVTLQWTDTSTNEDGFLIYYRGIT